MSPYWDRAILSTVRPSPLRSQLRPIRGDQVLHWYFVLTALTMREGKYVLRLVTESGEKMFDQLETAVASPNGPVEGLWRS